MALGHLCACVILHLAPPALLTSAEQSTLIQSKLCTCTFLNPRCHTDQFPGTKIWSGTSLSISLGKPTIHHASSKATHAPLQLHRIVLVEQQFLLSQASDLCELSNDSIEARLPLLDGRLHHVLSKQGTWHGTYVRILTCSALAASCRFWAAVCRSTSTLRMMHTYSTQSSTKWCPRPARTWGHHTQQA